MSVSDDNYGIGGTQDNDTELFTGTLDWTTTGACGDGGFTAFDTQTPTTVYTSCAIGSSSNLVFKSVFNGAVVGGLSTFNGADSGINSGDRSQFIPPLAIAGSNPTTLYYATCRIYQTTDSANTWTPITGDLSAGNVATTCPFSSSENITAIDAANHTATIVFAGTTNGKSWRTLNANLGAGSNWTEIDHGLLPFRSITSLRGFNGDASGNSLIAGFSGFSSCAGCDGKGHIFGTINGGTSWTNLSGD